MKWLWTLAASVGLPLLAAVNVVTTTTSMGVLAREVGGAHVQVTELASPDQDAHMLQAKPSMMRALRNAQLLVAVGAELEVGWLPAALQGAANPSLLPGKPGYFEAAAQVPLKDGGGPADRAYGDVHPMGNPHINMDPTRMATAALALAERLGKLDAAHRADYLAGAQAFGKAVAAREKGWRSQCAHCPGALLYHKDGDYLLAWLNVPHLGYLEPLPGVPPTAKHLEHLAGKLRGTQGVVIHTPWQGVSGVKKMANTLGWPMRQVPIDPPRGSKADGYFAVIDQWVAALQAKS